MEVLKPLCMALLEFWNDFLLEASCRLLKSILPCLRSLGAVLLVLVRLLDQLEVQLI